MTEATHKYYALNRPDIVPKPFEQWESWYPARPLELPEGTRHAFGFALYSEALPFDQVWGYDMLPADEAERVYYLLWLDAGRNDQRLAELIEDWAGYSDDELREYMTSSYTAGLMIRWRAHRYPQL